MMRVTLDACVLYPTLPRLFFEGAAAAGLVEPLWSARILEEWRRAVLRDHPDQTMAVGAEIDSLTARFPAAAVAPDAGLDAALSLPDPADTHVLATAIAGRAEAVVTFNLRDFPGRTLGRHGLQVRHPDSLLSELAVEAPDAMDQIRAKAFAAVPEAVAKNPRAALKRAGLPRLARALERAG